MLVSTKQIFKNAQRDGYAIGAFNTSDLEITKAIVSAAARLLAPVIIQTSEKAIAFAGLEDLAGIIKAEAQRTKVPIVLHLDHAKTLKLVAECLGEGYTSIMFDGSHLDIRENEIMTARAAQMAHRHGAVCEGELGSIGNSKTESDFTDPSLVLEFLAKTKVDSLAISIGSRHATQIKSLNIDLLKKIRKLTNVPLVLHGASGVPDEEVRYAVKAGICKVNIDTDIRHTFFDAIRLIPNRFPEIHDPRDLMVKIMAEVQHEVEEKIKLFGSVGRI